jgi:hypothetical protein
MVPEPGRSVAGQRYRIVVHGEFGDLLTAAFSDVSVSTGGGRTELRADVRDSQELYGLLDRLRDHGIHIEEVSEVG